MALRLFLAVQLRGLLHKNRRNCHKILLANLFRVNFLISSGREGFAFVFVSRFPFPTYSGETGNERKRNWKRAGNEKRFSLVKSGNEPLWIQRKRDLLF
jgi:hypothetical protein